MGQTDLGKNPATKRRRAPTRHSATSLSEVDKDVALLGASFRGLRDDMDEFRDSVKDLTNGVADFKDEVRGKFERLNVKLALGFGLLVGAMAASGLIKEEGAKIIGKLIGLM
jgi:hypothetical protein